MTRGYIAFSTGASTDHGVDAWYDTREGLEGRLKAGLEGLREIVKAREEAGYDRKERMAEWCVLGGFHMDTCGNFSKITQGAPIDVYGFQALELSYPPKVMTLEEIQKYTGHWVSTMGACLPPVDGRCDRCGKGWTFDNIRDFVWVEQDNPRHKSCHELAILEHEQRSIMEIVKASGIPHTDVYMIPNEYYPAPDIYGPWFMVQTPAGRIKIGWRKRVINIDWSETGLNVLGSDVVDKPDVTHGAMYVHAWGADKAVEALKNLWTLGKK